MTKLFEPHVGKTLIPLEDEVRGRTNRAGLTYLNSIIQQAARLIVNFLITPIVIGGLGKELYGAWLLLQQSIGYLSISDLRPMGTLKFTLAISQHKDDIGEKQRQIGSALLLWLITFPVILLIGYGVIRISPWFIHVEETFSMVVTGTITILVIGVILDRFFSLPGNVLRGMNLDYKAMGLTASSIIIGGVLSVLAINLGWGMIGLAAASVITILLNGIIRFFVAVKFLPWMRSSRPKYSELLTFVRLSLWLFLGSTASLVFSGGDLLLIGIVFNPSSSSIYAVTGSVLIFLSTPIIQLVNSGSPGIAGLCGSGDWEKVDQIRKEMHLSALLLLGIVGAGVLALNQSFLKLWIGEGFFAGKTVNLLFVLTSLVSVVMNTDSVVIDAALEFKKKALLQFTSACILIISGIFAASQWGLVGIAVSVLFSKIICAFFFQILIRKLVKKPLWDYYLKVARLIFVILILLIIINSFIIFKSISWLQFAFQVIAIGTISLIIFWFLGISGATRKLLINRLAIMYSGISRSR
jgi:O-antigen/teichoic acid export membrane protein